MKKYLAEGIGTFFLMLIIILTANNGAANLSPLAVGLALTGLTYAGWHISNAHFNPAITLAVLMRGRIDRTDALYYVIAQAAGAVLAALFGVFLLNCSGAASVPMHVSKNGLCALVAEFLGAFALAYVILNVAFRNTPTDQVHHGAAAGCTLASLTWALGSISGGAFNPAVALGASICGMYDWADCWIYLIGTLLGAAAAASAIQAIESR